MQGRLSLVQDSMSLILGELESYTRREVAEGVVVTSKVSGTGVVVMSGGKWALESVVSCIFFISFFFIFL